MFRQNKRGNLPVNIVVLHQKKFYAAEINRRFDFTLKRRIFIWCRFGQAKGQNERKFAALALGAGNSNRAP